MNKIEKHVSSLLNELTGERDFWMSLLRRLNPDITVMRTHVRAILVDRLEDSRGVAIADSTIDTLTDIVVGAWTDALKETASVRN